MTDLLRNIGTSAISDLILCLITSVEGSEIKQGLLEWLDEKQLIQSIIGLLDPALDRDTHDNASRLLIEILRVSRDAQYTPVNERCDDPLLNTLEDPKTVDLLLEVMFKRSGNESGGEFVESTLVNGIQILLTLVESRRQPLAAYAQAQLQAEQLAREAALGPPIASNTFQVRTLISIIF